MPQPNTENMNDKKQYWLVESNGDLSETHAHDSDIMDRIKCDFDDLDREAQEETQYTITPVWYTDEEYSKLPEA